MKNIKWEVTRGAVLGSLIGGFIHQLLDHEHLSIPVLVVIIGWAAVDIVLTAREEEGNEQT